MRVHSIFCLIMVMIALVLLGACSQPASQVAVVATATPNNNLPIDEIGTSVAATQTVAAQETAKAQTIQAALTGTAIALLPTDTVTPPPSATPTRTDTPKPVTPTPKIETAVPIPPPPPPPSFFAIKNLWSGMCLDVTYAYQDGAAVGQNSCDDSWNQKWRRIAKGGGYYSLVYAPSGMCMDIDGDGSPGNGIIQRHCSGADTQLWKQDEWEGSFFRAKSKRDGQCLDMQGFAKIGVQALYFACNYDPNRHENQIWIFEPNPDGGVSGALALPKGIYVKEIRLDSPSPREKQDVWFHVTFLNNTGAQEAWRWFVYIYRDDQTNPFGQTSSNKRQDGQDIIPPGTTERQALNVWHIVSGDGFCRKYWAKVFRYIPATDTSGPIAREILGANGAPIQKDFQVCP